MSSISKTDYILWRACAKNAWLRIHKPDVYYSTELTEYEQSVMEMGIEVERVARGLFPDGAIVTGSQTNVLQETRSLIASNTPTLFQPVFEREECLAVVDVLRCEPGTNDWSIYEVKSATKVKEEHVYDLAFQVALLRKHGINLKRASLILLNPDYVRQHDLDIQELFNTIDLTANVDDISETVSKEMQEARNYLLNESEPQGPCSCIYKGRSRHCSTFHYSNPDVPDYGIHDIARIGSSPKKLKEMVDAGIFALEDIPSDIKVTKGQSNQLRAYRTGETIIDKEAIAKELGELTFPLHFIDYETFASALPLFRDFSPYDQIPLQYSVHIVGSPGKMDRICFDEIHSSNAVLYHPGTPAFSRLVTRMVDAGLHRALDLDEKPAGKAQQMAKEWVEGFGGNFHAIQISEALRSFVGVATVRVRATVGHDSYERLVDVPVSPDEHWIPAGLTGASPISDPLKNPEAVGLNGASIVEKATQDPGVAEFCRFYLDRRTQELASAGTDARKRKKVEDDFTPRLDTTLVGMDGTVRRQLRLKTLFDLGSEHEYETTIAVIPAESKRKCPELYRCSVSQKIAPAECFEKCGISGLSVLKHLLVRSEVSDRAALPEFIERCAATGKRVLQDELEESSVTHQKVIKTILKTSDLSGKRAEPKFFANCEFTGTLALNDELETSQVSGKQYRKDRQQRSSVSGKTGYRDEFVLCAETGQPLLPEESVKCDVTGKIVAPGVLVICEVSGRKVLPSLLERSAVTGKRALKEFFVSSSISGARALQQESVGSAAGKYCLPTEAKMCMWSGRKIHPDDLRTCELTQVIAHFEYMTTNGACRLEPLVNLLNGLRRKADKPELWAKIAEDMSRIANAKSQVEAAILSPSDQYLAVCLETKNWLGLKTRQAGLLYSIRELEAVGRIVAGKRGAQGWALEKAF